MIAAKRPAVCRAARGRGDRDRPRTSATTSSRPTSSKRRLRSENDPILKTTDGTESENGRRNQGPHAGRVRHRSDRRQMAQEGRRCRRRPTSRCASWKPTRSRSKFRLPAGHAVQRSPPKTGTTVAVGAKLGEIEAGAAGRGRPEDGCRRSGSCRNPRPAPALRHRPLPPAPGRALRRRARRCRNRPRHRERRRHRQGRRITKPDVAGRAPAPPTGCGCRRPAGPRATMPARRAREDDAPAPRIAERLKEAQNTAAMLTTFNEVDMTAVMALRSQVQGAVREAHGVKLGFMSLLRQGVHRRR